MKRRQLFGLVFEQHISETTALHGLPIQAGSPVQRRDDPQAKKYLPGDGYDKGTGHGKA
jgi:hypothetical protein